MNSNLTLFKISYIVILCLAFAITGCNALKIKKTRKDQNENPFLAKTMEALRSTGQKNSQKTLPKQGSNSANNIPKLVPIAPAVPSPSPPQVEPTHTVIVNDVPVKELLFSLARDSETNIDIDPDVTGNITINAVNQPLNALLNRIAESSELIYEYRNNVLRIKMDKPFLKNYRIDYINIARSSRSETSVSTEIGAAAVGGEGESEGAANDSSTSIVNISQNDFWSTLRRNITSIIAVQNTAETTSEVAEPESEESDSEGEASEESKSAEAKEATSNTSQTNIIINQEAGLLSVRATQRRHKEVEGFLNEILYSTRRQVLIEATIAEVTLNNSFQAGIDWTYIDNQLSLSPAGISQIVTDLPLFDRPYFKIDYTSNENGDSIQTTLSALETFGDVRIVSSPKVMAINNQTALLKVVDNIIYFDLNVTVEDGEDSDPIVTFETEAKSLPVGFVMSVTPYISDKEIVTLSIRPTISRVIGYARDPNPSLAEVGVINEIPIVQVREVESVLKVGSKDIAVMGGLMQDETNDQDRGTPFLSRIPGLGSLFKYQDNQTRKSELVIFIRPTVINKASLNADLKHLESYLPAPR